ncbi:MAG: fatty acid desaturase, partial [Myxococcota bacterium]|nr:fatty acid desaturase [Myxococcota bacterium]
SILMAMQILSALNEIKGALEHGGEVAFHPEPLLRSRTSLFPGRNLIMPLNISMHFEHHLNHTVPWYDLMNYHRAIYPLVPEELRSNIFNHDILTQLRGELEAPMTEEMREAYHDLSAGGDDGLMPAAAE